VCQLLDHRIAEFAGRLASSASAPGCSKQVLRRAIDGIVPPMTRPHRQARLSNSIGTWLQDRNLNLMETMVFSGNSFARTYFDLPHPSLANAPSALSTDWSERLWRVLTLSVWGQVFGLS
jgi:hypothetical protein